MQPEHGAVIVISSHVVRGSVGSRAAVFALQTLGLPVWAVPTVILPWHPGHGRATSIVPDTNRFGALVGDLARSPALGSVRGVISGYLGDAGQAECIAGFIRHLKQVNPQVFYLCDPVIGDAGSLYVPEATAGAIRDHLLPLADLVTPNLSELRWLTGMTPATPPHIADAARCLSPNEVMVTSAPGEKPGEIGNLLLAGGDVRLTVHPAIANAPKGAGDLLAALFLGHRLNGSGIFEALVSATAAVYGVLAASAADGDDEMALSRHAALFKDPSPVIRSTRSSVLHGQGADL